MFIELYTASTPNGIKASIALEELGIPYTVRAMDLSSLEQKEDWYLKINPNGRIPAIVDCSNNRFTVFESGAILHYLAKKTGRLIGPTPEEESEVMQWLMFQMGGLGPMMGQANVFYRYADEKIPYAIHRYQQESRRLLEVLNHRLADHEYLASRYSIADIANWSWARSHAWGGISIEGLDHLDRWLADIADRPAVKRGIAASRDEEKTANHAQRDARAVQTARAMLVRAPARERYDIS